MYTKAPLLGLKFKMALWSIRDVAALPRSYVDPWDLENYAYIRQHLDSLDVTSSVGQSSLGEPVDANSSFYFDMVADRADQQGPPTDRSKYYESLLETDYGTARWVPAGRLLIGF